jgi:hypothetical protein
MSNPYGGPKPRKLRNPKVVVIFHNSGKFKVLNCFKFDVLKNDKGQVSDYVATSKEFGDWLTASIFPAKYWCTREEWEKRKEAREKSLPKTPAPAVLVAPAATVSAPVATAPPPTLPALPEPETMTFTPPDEENVSQAELAALVAPRVAVAPVSLDEEMPGEYNPKAHVKDKFAFGKPEDLLHFDDSVAKSLIDQEAKRRIEIARHRGEIQKKIMTEHAGFGPDSG